MSEQRFEHEVDLKAAEMLNDVLQERGEDGWELVAVTDDGNVFGLFWKRPAPTPPAKEPG